MPKAGITLLALILTGSALAQTTFNIQSGASLSKAYWKNSYDTRHGKVSTGFFASAGFDYFHHKYYNLSSNLGLIRKGSHRPLVMLPHINVGGNILPDPVFPYLSFNTQVDFKYPVTRNIRPFLSVGPRIDYLTSRRNVENVRYSIGEPRLFSIGLITGAGVKYDMAKYQLGLRSDYYLNFTAMNKVRPYTVARGQLFDETFTINFMLGFKLQ
jgi:hypothetical protein